MLRVPLVALVTVSVTCLNNGVGYLPELGFNSWYAIHSHLQNYVWEAGYVASDDVLNIAEFMADKGLLALGYTRINWDDCIVVGRNATGDLIPDPAAFPEGVRSVADKLHAQGYGMGWYTVRGDTTCASGPPPRIERPGSAGHELQDAKLWASWGIDYIKVSEVVGTQKVDSRIARCKKPPRYLRRHALVPPIPRRTTRAAAPKSRTPSCATP